MWNRNQPLLSAVEPKHCRSSVRGSLRDLSPSPPRSSPHNALTEHPSADHRQPGEIMFEIPHSPQLMD